MAGFIMGETRPQVAFLSCVITVSPMLVIYFGECSFISFRESGGQYCKLYREASAIKEVYVIPRLVHKMNVYNDDWLVPMAKSPSKRVTYSVEPHSFAEVKKIELMNRHFNRCGVSNLFSMNSFPNVRYNFQIRKK